MQPSTKISHSFTVAHALVNTPQSARDTILKSIDADKALRMSRLAYEVLEGLQFGLGGVKVVIEKWLEHRKGDKFDYRRGDGCVFSLTDQSLLWDAWQALDGSVGTRFMVLDASGLAAKIHVSLPLDGAVWWEGKKAWEVRAGQFEHRDFMVMPNGDLMPFDGKPPRAWLDQRAAEKAARDAENAEIDRIVADEEEATAAAETPDAEVH